MSDTQTTATQTAPAIIPGTEIATLPEVTTELVAFEQATDPKKQEMESIIAEIDMSCLLYTSRCV